MPQTMLNSIFPSITHIEGPCGPDVELPFKNNSMR